MPEDIRFVLEAPHVNRTQKKRPRLVTSCDNCRLKKIKCIQSSPESVCEACATASVSCRFRDRERYYAERSRIAAAQALAAKNAADKPRKGSPRAPDTTISQGQYVDSTAVQAGVTRSPLRRAIPYHPYRVSSMPLEPCFRSSPESDVSTPPPLGPLFDPNDLTRPHSEIMMTFIQVFFDNRNTDFPFLAYDETIRQFFTRGLTALLANCIAAHAVHYADMPEVTKRGIMHVSDLYCDRAKGLLASELEAPTLDTLHALILLAWAESNRNRSTEFCAYGQTATELAAKMGFSDQAIAQMATDEYERTILQATWSCVAILDNAVRHVSLF
ncbi:uncharacterized protein PHACADRAFT_257807 [Phanerochaete carnosa HHB-10118-sp]|uniref:Zn(2)-C6 fungal-type domain-containing protein n=1 Tax=Phanerochaete carnosa (strain HHB-10118-sp) TaxID=650164 RepID=K5WUM3_PHACS|nr:uncharacterized protein PHACADRAFT_257807 [Phanerochaete carnosa HHB-10118-sp]EKM54162.1 hypothetical protein PHACADRAFT_257807 [Phanerochaete carnosa HHB-10118-sp]